MFRRTGLAALALALSATSLSATDTVTNTTVGNTVSSSSNTVSSSSRALDAETRAAMIQAEKTMRGIAASANERFDSKINRVTTRRRWRLKWVYKGFLEG